MTENQSTNIALSSEEAGGTEQTPAQSDSSWLQQQVLGNLKTRRGIMNGKDLYRLYGENQKDILKSAILALQEQKLVSVKGNLNDPLGVFESVLVER